MVTKIEMDTSSNVDGEGRPTRVSLKVDFYQPNKEEIEIMQKLSAFCLSRCKGDKK